MRVVLLALLVVQATSGFYLPGVAPREFQDGEKEQSHCSQSIALFPVRSHRVASIHTTSLDGQDLETYAFAVRFSC